MGSPAKNPRRVVGGRGAVSSGKAFETLIAYELEAERRAGRVARHDRHQPLYRCIGPGRYVPAAKGGADHFGLLTGGLALLAVELRPPRAPAPLRFVLPWDRVPWEKNSRGLGASAVALAGWELPPGGLLRRFVAWCPGCQAWRLRWFKPGACCFRGGAT